MHLSGGRKMIEELVEVKKRTKIIGVSMLTSLDKNDLKDFGISCTEELYIENLMKVGVSSKIDGIVTSANEVKNLKKNLTN